MKSKLFTDSKAFVLLMGSLTALDPLSIDMYLPAFSDIQKEFNTSIGNVELSMSSFFIGMSLGQLFYGPLSDKYGRKKPLLIGMILYFIATIGCLNAPNIESFIFFRVLQALGGCAGMVITRAIIRDLFDSKRIAEFLSSLALVMGLAPILAPSIGAVINTHFGWRAIFIVLAAFNLISMISIMTFLPETHHKRLTHLNTFAVLKSYGKLFKEKSFIGYLIPMTAIRAGMFAYIAGSPFVFIELYKIPKEYYGWLFGLNALGLMGASQINRLLLKKYTIDQVLNWSVLVAALASLLVFVGPLISGQVLLILVPIFIFIATLNFVTPNGMARALANQGHQAGTASAFFGCFQWLLASVSSFFVGHFHNGTSMPMTGAILGCGIVSLVSFKLLAPSSTRN